MELVDGVIEQTKAPLCPRAPSCKVYHSTYSLGQENSSEKLVLISKSRILLNNINIFINSYLRLIFQIPLLTSEIFLK